MLQDPTRNNGNFSLVERNEEEPKSSEGEVFQANSQTAQENNIPRQAENANFANSVQLDLHTTVIDVDVVRQAGDEFNQTTSPERFQDTQQRAQRIIQSNLPDYEVFPTKIK